MLLSVVRKPCRAGSIKSASARQIRVMAARNIPLRSRQIPRWNEPATDRQVAL
jgi:hypothetical protein